MSQDGLLAAASEGVGISLFDPAQPNSVRRYAEWRCTALAVDGTRGMLGVCGTEKSLVFPVVTPEPAPRLLQFHPGAGRSISIAGDAGLTLAANSSGKLRLTDRNGKDLALPPALRESAVYFAALHPDGTALAAVHSTRKEIIVCDLPDGEMLASCPAVWQGPRLAFASRDRLLIGDRDHYTCLDFRTGRTIWKRPHEIMENRPRLVSAAMQAGFAAITPDNRSIELVSIENGEPILPPLALPRPRTLGDLAVDAAGRRVIAISPGGELQVWNVEELRRELGKLTGSAAH